MGTSSYLKTQRAKIVDGVDTAGTRCCDEEKGERRRRRRSLRGQGCQREGMGALGGFEAPAVAGTARRQL
jgi:hypothetical protein